MEFLEPQKRVFSSREYPLTGFHSQKLWKFCRFCGTGQPSEQLLARLRAEAEQIRLLRMQIQQQNNQQNDAYARLEAMRQQAEAAARLNNQQNQNYRPPGW